MPSFLDCFDLPILRFMTQFANRCEGFDLALFAISGYDSFKGVLLFSLLWFAWFLKARTPQEQTERRQTLLTVFAGTVLAVCAARLLQVCLDVHMRPVHMAATLGFTFPSVVDPQELNMWNSFPSDHAMYFFALGTGLWRVKKSFSLFVFGWTILMVFLPRLYLGIHHPSDIVAGAALGPLFMLGFLRLRFVKTSAVWVYGWGTRNESLFYGLAFLATINAAHLFDDARGIIGGSLDYLKGL